MSPADKVSAGASADTAATAARPGAPAPPASTAAEDVAREGYRLHGAELYRFALTRLGDDATAQDAVQETILRAWRSGARFDPARGSLRTWLFAIHRNVVLDLLTQRRWIVVDPHQDPPHDAASAPDHAGAVADHDAVVRALADLSPDHRTAVVETYLRDRPYGDVARDLQVPVATVRTRVFHALRQLRTTLTSTEEGR